MSKLYISATTDTIKTDRTARGHKHAQAHVRGWQSGISVEVDARCDGILRYFVMLTHGSNNTGSRKVEVLRIDCAETSGRVVTYHSDFHHTDGMVAVENARG